MRNDRTVDWQRMPAEQREVLSRTDTRHVVVLAECRQVLVQFLDTFLVSLDALAHQFFFQLLSRQYTIQSSSVAFKLTRLRLVSSWRRSYSVLPSPGTRLSSLFFSRCSRSVVFSGFAVSSLAGVASLDEAAAVVDLDEDDFFLRFFSMPVGLAPLSFRPPPADV